MKQLKIAKTGYILISILFYIFGVICILSKNIDAKTGAMAGGAILIAYGVIKITGYLSKDLFCLAFQYDFACGLFLIVLGILVLAVNAGFEHHLLSGMGALVLLDSLLCIQTALDAQKFGLSSWHVILFTSILSGTLGAALIVLHTLTSAGLALLAEGFMRQYIVQCTVRLSPAAERFARD